MAKWGIPLKNFHPNANGTNLRLFQDITSGRKWSLWDEYLAVGGGSNTMERLLGRMDGGAQSPGHKGGEKKKLEKLGIIEQGHKGDKN